MDKELFDKIDAEPFVAPNDDRTQDAVVRSRSSDALKLSGSSDAGEAVEYFHYDNATSNFTHEIVQDVEPVLEHIKGLRLDRGKEVGKNKAGDFYLAGRFPVVIVMAWLKQKGLHMKDFKKDVVKDFLNDPNHSAFRVWPGRV